MLMNISFHGRGGEVLAITCGRRTGAFNDSVPLRMSLRQITESFTCVAQAVMSVGGRHNLAGLQKTFQEN
jgi:hypothetical protein